MSLFSYHPMDPNGWLRHAFISLVVVAIYWKNPRRAFEWCIVLAIGKECFDYLVKPGQSWYNAITDIFFTTIIPYALWTARSYFQRTLTSK